MPRIRKQYPYGELPERKQVAYGSMNRKVLARMGLGHVPQIPLPTKQFKSEFDRIRVGGGQPALDQLELKPVTGPEFVQGKKASDLEARAYRAMLKLKWTDNEIVFQYPILGGRVPGGQVLDFVVFGFGMVYVLPVNGDYWHGWGAHKIATEAQAAVVQTVWPHALFYPLWTGDLLTDVQAYHRLLVLIGVGPG